MTDSIQQIDDEVFDDDEIAVINGKPYFTQQQLVDMLGLTKSAVSKLIANSVKDGKLNEKSVFRVKRRMNDSRVYSVQHYPLTILVALCLRTKHTTPNVIAIMRWLEDVMNSFPVEQSLPMLQTAVDPQRDRSGFVYLVMSDSGYYKIGRTVNPEDRMYTFTVKLPFDIEYVALIETDDMYALEKQLHDRFQDKRVNGEWFDLSEDDVRYMQCLPG